MLDVQLADYVRWGDHSLPRGWNRIEMQQQVIQASGAADLIQGVWDGEIDDLPPEIIEPISAWLKAHPAEVQAAGFSNIESVHDNQAVFTLLDWCGIKRCLQRRRVNGKIARFYRVDSEHLEKLKTIVERRSRFIKTNAVYSNLLGYTHE